MVLSASKKYTLASIASNGLVVGDIIINPIDEGNPNGFWDCFDNTFQSAAQDCYSVLTDTDNPVLMGMAWAGLPGTIAGCNGNSAYVAIVNCC